MSNTIELFGKKLGIVEDDGSQGNCKECALYYKAMNVCGVIEFAADKLEYGNPCKKADGTNNRHFEIIEE